MRRTLSAYTAGVPPSRGATTRGLYDEYQTIAATIVDDAAHDDADDRQHDPERLARAGALERPSGYRDASTATRMPRTSGTTASA